MSYFLDELDGQGGAARWLLDQGMEPDTLDLLRSRLLPALGRDVAVAG